MLDELDDLARVLAEATGWPRAHVVLSELLPAARGLHALADQGPRALADRRVIPRAAWLAGRSTRLVRSPVGVVGVRGPSASPWCEPVLETAASLLSGNAVLLAAGAAGSACAACSCARACPGELVTVMRRRGGARGALSPRGRPPTAEPARNLAGARGRAARAGGRSGAVGGVRRPRDGRWAARHSRGRRARPACRARAGARAGLEETIGPPEVVVTGRTIHGSVAPHRGSTLAVVEAPDADTAVRLASQGGRDAPISVWARDRRRASAWPAGSRRRRPGSVTTARSGRTSKRGSRGTRCCDSSNGARPGRRRSARRRDPRRAIRATTRARVAPLASAAGSGQGKAGAAGE